MVEIVELRHDGTTRSTTRGGSLGALARDEPPGSAYLVARTYTGGMVLRLEDHFRRLERSAREQGIPITVPEETLRDMLRTQIQGREMRFRVTVIPDSPPWYRISLEPARAVPEEILARGAACVVVPHSARREATVKSTTWMHERQKITPPGDWYEVFLGDDQDRLLEGATSNVYAVMDGVLYTAEAGVLPGIAREIVLTVAPEVIPVVMEAPNIADIIRFQECFISSATRGVVPVGRIGETRLPAAPGPVTEEIMARYGRYLQEHCSPL